MRGNLCRRWSFSVFDPLHGTRNCPHYNMFAPKLFSAFIFILLCFAANAATLSFPMNILGEEAMLEVSFQEVRESPRDAAAKWLTTKGYESKTDQETFSGLVASLTKHLIQKYNEEVSSLKATRTPVLTIPVTLESGKTVQMVHYSEKSALATVRDFAKEHGISDEAAAQTLFQQLQTRLQGAKENGNDTASASASKEVVIDTEVVFPVDFGSGKVAQFVFNPEVQSNVYDVVENFLVSNGITKSSESFTSSKTSLLQSIVSQYLQNRKLGQETQEVEKPKMKPEGKIILNLVVGNENKRVEIRDNVDAATAARSIASNLGLLGKGNEASAIKLITQQIISERKLVYSSGATQAPTDGQGGQQDASKPLFVLPVQIDGQKYGDLKYFPSQRPKDVARSFVRRHRALNDGPDGMRVVRTLTSKLEQMLSNLGPSAPKQAPPLIAFPVKLPGGNEAMFEYMPGHDAYTSAIDFVEENNQVQDPNVDNIISTLETALISRVIEEANRYASKFKIFSLPFTLGSSEKSLDLYYEEPPLLAANAFCLENSNLILQAKSSIALCTDTVVDILLRVLNGVESKLLSGLK